MRRARTPSLFCFALPILALLHGSIAVSCSVLNRGPDAVRLVSTPAGAVVTLRGGGRVRTLPGTTPMTIELDRTLVDPIEIIFSLDGHIPERVRLSMVRASGPELLPRDEWRWPTDPIEVRLLEQMASQTDR